jgi:hypothetical protein
MEPSDLSKAKRQAQLPIDRSFSCNPIWISIKLLLFIIIHSLTDTDRPNMICLKFPAAPVLQVLGLPDELFESL